MCFWLIFGGCDFVCSILVFTGVREVDAKLKFWAANAIWMPSFWVLEKIGQWLAYGNPWESMRTRPFLGPKNIPNSASHASTSWRRPVASLGIPNIKCEHITYDYDIVCRYVLYIYIHICIFLGGWFPLLYNNHHSWIFIRSMWDTQVAGHLAVLEAPPLLAEPGPKLAWLGLKTKTLLVRSWHCGHDFHWNLVKQVLKFI